MTTPLDALRAKIGATYGTAEFQPIITSDGKTLWKPSDGTTCAISVSWAFVQSGAPETEVNRGSAYVPGGWDGAIVRYARKFAAYWETHSPQTLQTGDIFLVTDPKGVIPWHMGIVEMNLYPQQLVTIDGGQSNAQGQQMINRVVRPYDGELITGPPIRRNGVFVPNKRQLAWRIDTAKVFKETGQAPPAPVPAPNAPNAPNTPQSGGKGNAAAIGLTVAALGAAGYYILRKKGKKGNGPH